MRISTMKACCLFLLIILPCSLWAQATTAQKVLSPREFVEGFYKWYRLLALKDSGRTSDLALKYKSSAFSPQLLRLLKADSAAQAACGELVGLDFDPFLYTNDTPEDRYDVGNIHRIGQNYRVEIYGVWSGVRSEKPSVIAEVAENNGHWYFVNFHYEEQGGADLLTILKSPEKCTVPRTPGKK